MKWGKWTVVRRSRSKDEPTLDGYCDHARRRVFISHKLEGDELIETALHEALHAELPDLSESSVDRIAKRMVSLLKMLKRSKK